MALDPRSPVIVGAGQLTRRPPAGGRLSLEEVQALPEPAEMMAEALRRAQTDSGATADLLARAQRVAVASILSWPYANPGLLLAGLLGAEPSDTVVTTAGGNSPQMLVHRAAEDIAAGRLDVALITGVEAMYARRLARAADGRTDWTHQPSDTPAPRVVGDARPGSSDAEGAASLVMPVQFYPLFENALRRHAGESIDEHQRKVSELWARFSDVAAGNPHAWSPVARTAAEIRTVGPDNRMIGFPYPKLMNANMSVDQASGLIVCSVEEARRCGVPEDRWVFVRSGAEAHDHWFVSERTDFHSSPAIRLAGQRAFEIDGSGIDDVAHVDLYSCFPAPVQIAASELGLGLDEADRPLTVTGGLGFGGGPGNNYVGHSIATMCDVLRRDAGSLGLVTALGWYITKHAIGLYSTRPPEGGFRWESVQDAVDALPRREVIIDAEGSAEIETYTVMHERDGSPSMAIVVAALPDGRRAVVNITDFDAMRDLMAEEGCGRQLRLLGGTKAELVP